MTTNTFSGPIVHNSDAEFRAWGLAISNALTTAGFPKSADTGQINWATVTRPGSGAAGGYEIRYLNDSLHGTKPCYVKIEYGTGSTANGPAMWITCGTGTNGSGTISGTMMSRSPISQGVYAGDVGNFPTFICVKDGYMAIAAYRGGVNNGGFAFFSVSRMCDAAGDPTSAGFHFLHSSGSTSSLTRKSYVTSEISDGSSVCLFPGGNTTTMAGSDIQIIRHFGYTPTIRCVPFYLGFLNSEIGNESTFSATPVGVTSRTYLALGGAGNAAPTNCSAASASSTHRLAMQYD